MSRRLTLSEGHRLAQLRNRPQLNAGEKDELRSLSARETLYGKAAGRVQNTLLDKVGILELQMAAGYERVAILTRKKVWTAAAANDKSGIAQLTIAKLEARLQELDDCDRALEEDLLSMTPARSRKKR